MFLKDFLKFLREYNIIALAVAFVMGVAATALVSSLVKDIVMPIISPLLPEGGWETATLNIRSIEIAYGSFLAELINFLIIALVIFIVVRKLIKHDQAK